MKTTQTIQEVREIIASARSMGKSIGFVPTMGSLHAGHLSLVEKARQQCEFVVVSIFVNPTQFNDSDDFEKYPRDPKNDLEICRSASVDLVFCPEPSQMYPHPQLTWVQVRDLTQNLCGEFRPGHFDGVTTVCSKLFNIVCPDRAYFGMKDYQQLAVIRRMVKDLNLPLEIVPCPTVREVDGLAVSSRNLYLSEIHRKEATLIHTALEKCRTMVEKGYNNAKSLIGAMQNILSASSMIEIQYIRIVDSETLEDVDMIEKKALAAVAVKIGSTRLIDNTLLEPSTQGG